jgi:hypothetical protein
MFWEKKGDKRWFDMAIADYYHNRINRMGPNVCIWFPKSWRADVKLHPKRRKRNTLWENQ